MDAAELVQQAAGDPPLQEPERLPALSARDRDFWRSEALRERRRPPLAAVAGSPDPALH